MAIVLPAEMADEAAAVAPPAAATAAEAPKTGMATAVAAMAPTPIAAALSIVDPDPDSLPLTSGFISSEKSSSTDMSKSSAAFSITSAKISVAS